MDAEKRRLTALKQAVAAVPEGRALLQLARAARCGIRFGGLPDDDMVAALRCRVEDDAVRYSIHLSPAATQAELAAKLAHELRHLWQMTVFPVEKTLRLSVPMRLQLTRVLEGDAHAFEDYFRAASRKPVDIAAFDWKGAFDRFQQTRHAAGYDIACVFQSAITADAIRDELKKSGAGGKAPLAPFFNRAAQSALAGVEKVLLAGIDAGAKPYIDAPLAALLRDIRGEIAPEDMARARQLDRAIRRITL